MLRKISILLVLILKNMLAFAQLLYNNGALISVKSGATLIVKTNSIQNASGTIDNAGTIRVEGSFTNDANANGGGASGVYQIQNNWINNGTFTPNTSQVELYGANQLIGGTSVTNFSTLTLTGTGIKSQGIDATVNATLELNDRELATNNFKMSVINTNINAVTRTTGFVSSTNNGRLSRAMASASGYLFPVGSSAGTPRYRPIVVTPASILAHQYEIRFANVDATAEGFDRNTRAANVCEVNPSYYHLIDRTLGNSPANLSFFYDPLSDGVWNNIAHWQIIPQWQNTSTPTYGVAPPFNTITIANWNNFDLPAFALANLGPDANVSGNVTICQGQSATISFTGTPNAVVNYNINGIGLLNLTLDALGQATINTGILNNTTSYHLLNAYLPATPLCLQNFSTIVTITVTNTPSISPIYHD
jgi:hypothetical protein